MAKVQPCSQPKAGKRKAQDCSQETAITKEALTASRNPWEGQVLNRHRFTAPICYSTASSLEETCGLGKSESWRVIEKKDDINGSGSAQYSQRAYSDTLPGMFSERVGLGSQLWAWCFNTQMLWTSHGLHWLFHMKTSGPGKKKNRSAAFRDICVGATDMGTTSSAAPVDVSSGVWELGAARLVSGSSLCSINSDFQDFWCIFALGPLQLLTLSHEFSCFFSTLIQRNRTKHCVWFSNVIIVWTYHQQNLFPWEKIITNK